MSDEYLFDDPRLKVPYSPDDTVTIEVRELADLKAKEAMLNRNVERLDAAIAVLNVPISAGDFKSDAVIRALRDARAELVTERRKLARIADINARVSLSSNPHDYVAANAEIRDVLRGAAPGGG